MVQGDERGLRLAEAMILLAALAPGSALARPCANRMMVDVFAVTGRPFLNSAERARHRAALLYPFVTPATVVLPLLILRRRRRYPCGTFKSSGATVCVAAVAGLIVSGVALAPRIARNTQYMVGPIQSWLVVAKPAGFTVLGAWIALRSIGVEPNPKGVLDRMGMVLGAVWCLGAIAWTAIDFIMLFVM